MGGQNRGRLLGQFVSVTLNLALYAVLTVIRWGKLTYGRSVITAAGHRLGLERQTTTELGGLRDGIPVSVDLRTPNANRPDLFETHIEIGETLPAFKNVSMAPKRWTERLLGGLSDAVKTGDPAFDAKYSLRGPREKIYRLFGPSVRRRALELADDPFTLDDGRVTYMDQGILNKATLIRRVLRGTATAKAIADQTDTRRMDAERFSDEIPSVRRALLDWAIETRGATPTAIREAALKDPDAQIRLDAARALGTIDAMVMIALDGDAPRRARADALNAVVAQSPQQARPLALQLMSSTAPNLRAGAANAARTLGVVEALPALRQAALTYDDAQTVTALAAALGSLGSAEDATWLARQLNHSDTEVRLAAVGALAAVGTVVEVPPLHALTTGMLNIGRLPSAARAAVEAIQSRLGDVAEGRLSLHSGRAGGELTVADEEG